MRSNLSGTYGGRHQTLASSGYNQSGTEEQLIQLVDTAVINARSAERDSLSNMRGIL